jgi:hypothetical protein
MLRFRRTGLHTKIAEPRNKRYTKQFSTKAMEIYQYHGDTDEAPTVDAGNLSVSLIVGTPAVSAILARARCLSSMPFDLRYRRLRSGASWSGCVQKAQTSRGLTPVASENDQLKDLFRRRKGRILGLRRQIGQSAQTRKLNVPFEVGIVSLIASKSIHASNCEFRNKPLALENWRSCNLHSRQRRRTAANNCEVFLSHDANLKRWQSS